MTSSSLTRVNVAVVATDKSDRVHLLRYSFECSADDRANGAHHELANRQCVLGGFTPRIAIDESEPAWAHLASQSEMQINQLDVGAATLPVMAYMHPSSSDCVSTKPDTYTNARQLVLLDDARRACNYYQSRFSKISGSCKRLEERNTLLEGLIERVAESLADPNPDLGNIATALQDVTIHDDVFIERQRLRG